MQSLPAVLRNMFWWQDTSYRLNEQGEAGGMSVGLFCFVILVGETVRLWTHRPAPLPTIVTEVKEGGTDRLLFSGLFVILVLRSDQSSSMGLLSSWASSAMSSSSPEPIRLFSRFPATQGKQSFIFPYYPDTLQKKLFFCQELATPEPI